MGVLRFYAVFAAALCVAGCLPDPPPPPADGDAARRVPAGPTAFQGEGGAFQVTPAGLPTGSLPPAVPVLADPPSAGGTITFQEMGAPGWYPSRRDPASGKCDAWNKNGCCLARHEPSGRLAPWDEELIVTLRGPMLVERIVAYQSLDPQGAGEWKRVSLWEQGGASSQGISFPGSAGFQGTLGNKCLVDVATDKAFPCGPGSEPFCPASTPTPRYGWEGSKLLLFRASMPRFGDAALQGASHCSTDPADNWYDAPWIGLSHGELIRSGKFGNCHCYAKNPEEWWLADGCGQFNVFEVVNDNNAFRNLQLFSTNFFAYHGYVGEGPCGTKCDLTGLAATADLVDKATSRAAAAGALAGPGKGPGAAFRRPAAGYRWFAVLMDAGTRTVQLAVLHPDNLPAAAQGLAQPPAALPRAAIDALLAMRLPAPVPLGIRR